MRRIVSCKSRLAAIVLLLNLFPVFALAQSGGVLTESKETTVIVEDSGGFLFITDQPAESTLITEEGGSEVQTSPSLRNTVTPSTTSTAPATLTTSTTEVWGVNSANQIWETAGQWQWQLDADSRRPEARFGEQRLCLGGQWCRPDLEM